MPNKARHGDVFIASTAFVVSSYKYHFVQAEFLLLGAAISGAAFMAVGLFSHSNISIRILSQHVEIQSVKKRLSQLQS